MTPRSLRISVAVLVVLLAIVGVAGGVPWWLALPAAIFSVFVNAVVLRWEDGEYPPVRLQRVAFAVLGFVVLLIVVWQLLT